MASKRSDKLPAATAHVVPRGPKLSLIPAASREWARKKFEHFSLSRYSDKTRPANVVPPKHAKNAAAIHQINRKTISKSLGQWPKDSEQTGGLSLSLSNKDLRTLLPSYKPSTGTVKVDEVLAALKAHMTGTQFYSTGSPPLARLAEQEQLRKSAQSIIQSIKDNAALARKPAAKAAAAAKKPVTSGPRKGSTRP